MEQPTIRADTKKSRPAKMQRNCPEFEKKKTQLTTPFILSGVSAAASGSRGGPNNCSTSSFYAIPFLLVLQEVSQHYFFYFHSCSTCRWVVFKPLRRRPHAQVGALPLLVFNAKAWQGMVFAPWQGRQFSLVQAILWTLLTVMFSGCFEHVRAMLFSQQQCRRLTIEPELALLVCQQQCRLSNGHVQPGPSLVACSGNQPRTRPCFLSPRTGPT